MLLCVVLTLFTLVLGHPQTAFNKLRRFELTITWGKNSPDGVEREMFLVNGQYPGPLLELDEGDEVEVTVHNQMERNTTIHFHGIEMLDTPWSDGVPGLTQRPIMPGNSFTYRWTATQYGSYWYHAHERGQLDDGLYGPIVIHPSKKVQAPFKLVSRNENELEAITKAADNATPLLLSDFRHLPSDEAWEITVESGIELPCYDSLLLNGKGSVSCWDLETVNSLLSPDQQFILGLTNTTMTNKSCLPALTYAIVGGVPTNLSVIPPSVFDVCKPSNGSTEVLSVTSSASSSTWVALDLVATFGLHTAVFSIDEHPLWVYAVDGSFIEPQLVEAITLTNGDRFSVLVKIEAGAKDGNFVIRLASNTATQMLNGFGVLSVARGDKKSATPVDLKPSSTPYVNPVGVPVNEKVTFFNQTTMKAYPAPTTALKAEDASHTFILTMRSVNFIYAWALNGTVFPNALQMADPPLLFVPPIDPSAANEVEVLPAQDRGGLITTRNGTWVDLVFVAGSFPMPSHPIHKHGSKMYLLGSGDGPFNYSSVAEAAKVMPAAFNFVDPPQRDGFATPPAPTGPTWMAVRYFVNNPGAWFLHCHIQTHLQGGMAMAIQDGVDKWPVVPDEYKNYH